MSDDEFYVEKTDGVLRLRYRSPSLDPRPIAVGIDKDALFRILDRMYAAVEAYYPEPPEEDWKAKYEEAKADAQKWRDVAVKHAMTLLDVQKLVAPEEQTP